DTNAQWTAFRALPADLREMIQRFEPLSHAEAQRTAVRRPWRVGGDWPPELSEPLLATPRSTELLGYYRYGSYCVAIEWQTGRAWSWSCRAVRWGATVPSAGEVPLVLEWPHGARDAGIHAGAPRRPFGRHADGRAGRAVRVCRAEAEH